MSLVEDARKERAHDAKVCYRIVTPIVTPWVLKCRVGITFSVTFPSVRCGVYASLEAETCGGESYIHI